MTDKGLVIGLIVDKEPKAAAKPAPVMEKVSAPVEEPLPAEQKEIEDEAPVMEAEVVAEAPRRRGRPRKNP